MTEPGFQGQKGLNRKLRKMGPAIKEVMGPRMMKVGEEAKFEMQAIILAEAYDSGDLASVVHFKADSSGTGVRVGFWKAGNKKRWETAGWRAHFVNFGTSDGQVAINFIARTFNKIRKNVARDVDKDVDRALKKVSRDGR